MTSKLSQLATAAGRTWSVNQVVTAAQMNSDVAGTAAFVQGGAGNRPMLWAQNTTGVTIGSGSTTDLTFDTYTDYDSGWNGSTTYTVKTAGFYQVTLSPFIWNYVNSVQYRLYVVLNGTSNQLAGWLHTAFDNNGSVIYYPGASFAQSFAVNDTIKFQVRSQGAAASIPSTGSMRPTLSIQWVSA